MHANAKLFFSLSMQSVKQLLFFLTNRTQKQIQDVKPELLYHLTKTQPD